MISDQFDQREFDAAHARADRMVGEHLSRWRKGELREYGEHALDFVGGVVVEHADADHFGGLDGQ